MEKQTIGKQFQSELENALYDSKIVKPWQLRTYKVHPIYLSCTLDDLKTYWNQDARFREGFDIEKSTETVYIPNFFVKIDGVYEDEKKYNELLEFFTKNSYFELFYERDIEDWDYKFRHLTQNNKVREKVEKIIKKDTFVLEDVEQFANENFHNLNSYISSYIIDSLNSFIKNRKQSDKTCNLVDVVLSTLNMNYDLFEQFANWDFGFQVPKVVIINSSERNLNSSYMDFIDFLNFLGVDIIYVSTRGEKISKKSFDKITTLVLDKFKKPKTRWEVQQEIEKEKTKKFIKIVTPIILVIVSILGLLFYNTKYTVYHLKEEYEIGTIITDEMLIEKEVNLFTYEKNMCQDKKEIINKILIHNLNKEDIITSNDIVKNLFTFIDYEMDDSDYLDNVDEFIVPIFENQDIDETTEIIIKNENSNCYMLYNFYDNETLVFSSELIKSGNKSNILKNEDKKLYDVFDCIKKDLIVKVEFLNENKEVFYTAIIDNVTLNFVENVDEKENTTNTSELKEMKSGYSSILPLLRPVCLIGTIISVVSFVFSFASYDDRRRGSSIMMLLIFSTMLMVSTFILPKFI